MSPPPQDDPLDTAGGYILLIAVITYLTLLFTAANTPPQSKQGKPWDKCTLTESPPKPHKTD